MNRGWINNNLANYTGSVHPDGTTAVGAFGTIHEYGVYDTAGNVWEWTSSVDGTDRIRRGGGWTSGDAGCSIYYPGTYKDII